MRNFFKENYIVREIYVWRVGEEVSRGREKKRKTRTYPRTSITNVQMIPPLLGRELCARLAGDEVAEGALLTLELSCGVCGFYPVGYLVLFLLRSGLIHVRQLI